LLHALDLIEHLGQCEIIALATAFLADAPLHELNLPLERRHRRAQLMSGDIQKSRSGERGRLRLNCGLAARGLTF